MAKSRKAGRNGTSGWLSGQRSKAARTLPVRLEDLEARMLMSTSVLSDAPLTDPVGMTALTATAAVTIDPLAAPLATTVPANKSLLIPISGGSGAGLPLQYSVASSNGAFVATVLSNVTYLQLNVSIGGAATRTMVFQLFSNFAPNTVARISTLVGQNFYNGLTFHRIISDFMAQGGDPAGNGSGGTGVKFDDEFNANAIFSTVGQLAMANSGCDTNDSQFFITDSQTRYLDYNHTIFGQLVRGWDTFAAIMAVGSTGGTPSQTVRITSAQVIADDHDAVLLVRGPGAGQSTNLTVTADDGAGGTSQLVIPVTSATDTTDDPPFLGSLPNEATLVNQATQITLSSTDLESNPVVYGWGITANATGTLTGSVLTITPATGFYGTLNVIVGVAQQGASSRGSRPINSAQDLYDTQNITITVQRPAKLTVLNGSTVMANNQATPISLGSTYAGGTGPTKSFTIRNNGDVAMNLSNLVLPTGYSVVDGLVATLPAGQTDTLTIRLDPAVVGTKSGAVIFNSTDPTAAGFAFVVSGTVVSAPTATVLSGVTPVTDNQVDPVTIGSTYTGGPTVSKSFTITNAGGWPLSLASLSVPTGYTVIDGLAATISPGMSDTLILRLDSSVLGTKAGHVTFTSNDPSNSTFDFQITGSVVNPAALTVLDGATTLINHQSTPIDFGTTLVGGGALTHTFTVRNDGDWPLTLASLSVPAGFSIVDGFTTPLTAGQSDTITLRLDSTVRGAKSGNVTFASNAPGASSFGFAVSGTVQAPATLTVLNGTTVLANNRITPTNIGTAYVGGAGVTKNFTIRNDGDLTLTLSNLTVPAGFTAVDGLAGSLAPGQTDTVTLRVDTAEPGFKTGHVTFNSNDVATFDFIVSGTVTDTTTNLLGDVNGDGKQELVRFDASTTGNWSVITTSGGVRTEAVWGHWSTAVTWQNISLVDLNGDGKTDILARTGASWWAAISNGSAFTNFNMANWNGAVQWLDIHTGDMNGDGKMDVIARTSGGAWWAGISTGTAFTNVYMGLWSSAVQWLNVNVADVNGDGKSDVIARTSGGAWWAGISNGATLTNVYMGLWSTAVQWVDINVADVDGDGKADIIGRTSGGGWWAGISNGTTFTNRALGTWSAAVTWTDVRMTDLNGDGKADILGRVAGTSSWWAGISNGSTITSVVWA